MYHVETINIGKKHPMFPYLDRACLCANNMYNVANFHIRNLMTGLHKNEHERTQNEKDVLRLVSESVPAINERLAEKYEARKKRIEDDERLSGAEKSKRIDALDTGFSTHCSGSRKIPTISLFTAMLHNMR